MKLSYRTEINAKILSALYDKPLDKKDWYKINASEESEEVEILIYDPIGWPWFDASMLVNAMNEFKGRPLKFGINSPGGDVIDSIAIYQAMKRHNAKVTTRIDSLAASSASVIAIGGTEVNAYKTSTFMIHNPWTFAVGNEFVMEEVKDVLKQFGSQILDIYADKATVGKREIKQLMNGSDKRDGTWMTAKEAKEKGFVDNIIEGESKVKANINLPIFAGAMEFTDNPVDKKRKAEHALRDVGFSQTEAKAILARGWNEADGCLNDIEEPKKETVDQRDAEIADALKSLTNNMYGGYKNG